MDLSAPQHPMMAHAEREVIQWTAFDPLGGPVRASTHAYRSNATDDKRVRLDEAINYSFAGANATLHLDGEPALPTRRASIRLSMT